MLFLDPRVSCGPAIDKASATANWGLAIAILGGRTQEYLGSGSTLGYPRRMRLTNYWLLGCVLFLDGACGARTGEFDDTNDAGNSYITGGASYGTGGASWATTGGIWNTGGTPWAVVGGWYAGGGSTGVCGGYLGCPCNSSSGCLYPNSCVYGTCSYDVTTGGASTCPVGTWGCACGAGNYCSPPYSCYYGSCAYETTTGGASTCPTGSLGCSCYSGNYCNLGYSCTYGTCTYPTATGGAPSCLAGTQGCSCLADGDCYQPYVCNYGYCQYLVSTGGTPSYGGSYATGGAPGYGGSYATGGTHPLGTGGTYAAIGGAPPIVNCTNSLATCALDPACGAILNCVINSVGTCQDLTCYIAKCQSTLTGSASEQEALQIILQCSTVI